MIEGIDWGHSSFYNGASPLKDREILLLDSTLREGAQAPEVSFTTRQMLHKPDSLEELLRCLQDDGGRGLEL